MNEALRDEPIRMDTYDQTVRAELAAERSLFDGYHPRMAAAATLTQRDSGRLFANTAGRRSRSSASTDRARDLSV